VALPNTTSAAANWRRLGFGYAPRPFPARGAKYLRRSLFHLVG
jgi:hypothetical protein